MSDSVQDILASERSLADWIRTARRATPANRQRCRFAIHSTSLIVAPDAMTTLVGAAFVVIFVWAYWGRRSLAKRRAVRVYGALLDGMNVDPGSGAISGVHRGATIIVRFPTRRVPWTYRDVADWTEIVVSEFPRELRLSLRHRSPSEYQLGAGDSVKTGDPAFDGTFWISGAPSPWVLSMLSPDARARLLHDHWLDVDVREGTMVYGYCGFFGSADEVAATLSLLLDLRSRAVTRASVRG